MGATLPLVVGSRSSGQRSFGQALGRLYGWNTLGAVCGALAAELVLVNRVGIVGSAWAASLLSVTAASLAYSLTIRRRAHESEDSDAEFQSAQPESPPALSGATKRRRTVLTC